MKILKDDRVIVEDCVVAKTFFQKLRGKFLIKKPLLLLDCNAIHTIFMRKKIDVVFLNKENKIIKIYENLLPRCILFPVFNAKNVLEFDAGFIKNAKLELGNIITFKE